MNRWFTDLNKSIALATILLCSQLSNSELFAQSGLRESLEKLDTNNNQYIEPDEITPLARPYLEQIVKVKRMSLDHPNSIARLQEAARVHSALRNGVKGEHVRPEGESTVKQFGDDQDTVLVPEFGLAEIKFPYTQADVDFAGRTLRSNDHNRDGFIDRQEAARSEWTHLNPFHSDLNKDDRISRMELIQRYARRRLLDNATGNLSSAAWRAKREREEREDEGDRRRESERYWRNGGTRYYLTATVLGRFDTNRNGRLESTEAKQLGVPAGRIDVDRDGELSRDELQAYFFALQEEAGDSTEGLPAWFFELDKDRDGQVAMSEFAVEWTDARMAEFASLDTNGDALLTPSEVIQSQAITGGVYENDDAQILPPSRTIISEIDIAEDYIIGDLNVRLSITHTHVDNLDAFLTGPDGQRIELFTDIGGSGDHFDGTLFDDQAETPVNKSRPPYQGRVRPEGVDKKQPSLSYFNGKSIKGVWQLVIRGTRSDRFGMLHRWSIMARPEGESYDPNSFVTTKKTETDGEETSPGERSKVTESSRSGESRSGESRSGESRSGESARAEAEAKARQVQREQQMRREAEIERERQRERERKIEAYRKMAAEKKADSAGKNPQKDGYDKRKDLGKKDYGKKDYGKKDYGKNDYGQKKDYDKKKEYPKK